MTVMKEHSAIRMLFFLLTESTHSRDAENGRL
jgi:hypothetical protein